MNEKEKYNTLKRKLHDHDFKDAFGIDSVPLVEKLLEQYLKACDSFKSLEEKQSKLASDLVSLQAQMFPLRKENAKLARENNELHLDHIHHIESARRDQQDHERKFRELSDELLELRMLNKVTNEQLREKEKLLDKMRESYESLVDPALKSKQGNATIKSTTRLSKTPHSVATAWTSVANENDQSIIELLRKQLEEAHCKIRESEVEVNTLKSAVAAREQELSRASRLIGNGAVNATIQDSTVNQSFGMITGMDPASVDLANKRIIDQLNGQVDFLNSQLAFREAQIAELYQNANESQALKHEMANKNHQFERLKEENGRISNRMKMLENKLLSLGIVPATPKSVSIHIDRELGTETKDAPDIFEAEKIALQGEIFSLQKELILADKAKGNNQDMLLKVSQEKQQLQAELSYLQSEMVILKKRLEDQKTKDNGIPNVIHSFAVNKGNESKEMEQLKVAKEELENVLMMKDQSYQILNDAKKVLEAKVVDVEKYLRRCADLEGENGRLKNVIFSLTEEKRGFMEEKMSNQPSWQEPQEPTFEAKAENEKELVREFVSYQTSSKQELELLQNRISWLNQEMVLLQERNRSLLAQNEKLCDKRNGESNESGQLKSVIQELQRNVGQLNDTVRDLQQMKENLEMKLLLVSQDYRKLNEEKAQLEKEMKLLEEEKFFIRNENQSVHEIIKNVQHSYQLLQEKCSMYEQVMILELEQQLSVLKEEKENLSLMLHDSQASVTMLNNKVGALEQECYQLRNQEQLFALRQNQLLHEKDQLEVSRKEILATNNSLEEKIEELNKFIFQLQSDLQQVDQQYQGLQQQHDELKFHFQCKTKNESYQNEDLLLLTKENQSLSMELSQYHTENHQLQELIKNLKQDEVTLKNSLYELEIEKKDLLNHYRIVLKEKRKLEQDVKAISMYQSDGVASIQSLQKEYLDLQMAFQVEQANHEKAMIEKSSLLSQIELLNESISELQRKLDTTEGDNRRMIQELHSLKQSNAVLNDRISSIVKRSTAANEANRVLTTRLSAAERERDSLRSLVEVERQRAADMLKVAEAARIEAVTRDIQLQRMRAEISSRTESSPSVHSSPTSSNNLSPLANDIGNADYSPTT